MSFLHSNILTLRSIESDDLAFLFEVENDSNAWIQSENYVPFSKSLLDKYVNGEHDLLAHRQYRFMIDLKDNAEAIGCVDLFNYDPVHARAGVGIYISSKSRSKGYAKEALRLLAEYSKEVLNIELLYCSIVESNSVSLSLFKSAEYEVTGKRKGWSKIGGKRESVQLLQRLL